MYSIFGYGNMIADRVRMDAYYKALQAAIEPNSIVLDIGTGTGIFALLACQFGAKKVYAIEPSDAIEVGKKIANINRYSDRIQFIQQFSTNVRLPELVDIVISDLRGTIPLLKSHIPVIIDARKRLLSPDGILIPQRDILWAAVVEAPELYSPIVDVWENNAYGLNMAIVRQIVLNNWSKGKINSEQLLTTPQSWVTLDYTTINSPDVSAQLNWIVTRNGTAHGLSIWFDAILAEGIGFSNAPSMPELVYGMGFLPWLTPVSLAIGDTVSVTLQANLVGDDYIWRWNTCILDRGNPKKVKAKFQQSTFFGMPVSLQQLGKSAANYVPKINEEGEIDRLILNLMSSGKTIGDIASMVWEQFPTRFVSWHDTLKRVTELSRRYS
ncbi:MAG TPA: class I SAM-dependent methyltransferase [Leptolyngbyaceae cyanobacterium]